MEDHEISLRILHGYGGRDMQRGPALSPDRDRAIKNCVYMHLTLLLGL
jgi:hypothetical protein